MTAAYENDLPAPETIRLDERDDTALARAVRRWQRNTKDARPEVVDDNSTSRFANQI